MSLGCTGICVSCRKASPVGLQRGTGGREASRGKVASNVWSGLVPRIVGELEKCKSAGQPRRSKQFGGGAGFGGAKPLQDGPYRTWRARRCDA